MPASNPIQVKYPLDKRLDTFEDVANRICQGYPGNLAFIKLGVYATKVKLGAIGCQLETEHGFSQYLLGDEILDWRWRIIDRYGLESQAHQTVGRKLGGLKRCRILCCSAYRLVLRLW